jgi:cytoskeleton protein RodZ
MSSDSAPGVPQSNVAVSATSLSGSSTTPAALTVSAERSPGSAQPVSGEAIVVFSARGSSWIQVTDATGAAVLKKELGPGETAGASGVLPLAVVIGRADMTTVEVRGKPMDLAAVAKNNVARFEVKE